MEYMESKMQDQIEGAISAHEALELETKDLREQLQAIQDHGANFDLYAEAAGRWSIRESSGERTLFKTIREAADALKSKGAK